MDAGEFIHRWAAREGGAERANYQMFLSELCDVIGVARPDVAGVDRRHNDYVFERAVRTREGDSSKRIDLYKKGCFILEAKQSRLADGRKVSPEQLSLLGDEMRRAMRHDQRGFRGSEMRWDAMMQNARRQAEHYVFLLDSDHPAPPFIITCDVGYAIELFADFSGTGRAYTQFPDRNNFRISLEDLAKEEVRERLAKVWTNPRGLDPTRESARVTREIAKRLAQVSKSLEAQHAPEEVALFLMRMIFTMFAEDVNLLPKGEFTKLLAECRVTPEPFAKLLDELWQKMDEKEESKRFFSAFRQTLRHFNGSLFHQARIFHLEREEIGELHEAAKAEWREVDPAIFGTLLEQALDPAERRKLGAHYTPRAYVERLVRITVMEPLRADWSAALIKAEDAQERGNQAEAAKIVRAFHHKLCTTRVLDPACGTGNFLYVALEMMKRLEGEVLEVLTKLGVQDSLALQGEAVRPDQFLGLEINPRAAAIAELVIWIGYLQQHYRNRSSHPPEPILRAFGNINRGRNKSFDAVIAWDGYPLTQVEVRDGESVERCPHPRRPEWPEAEFVVGNPPFIGGKDIRSRLGNHYAEALWKAHPHMNESADFVMYWWDRAAESLTRKGTKLRRFGMVTTNSISQVFQRRAVERHLTAKNPVSLVFAVPDHPWTKVTRDAAAVRIAMTVARPGEGEGALWEVQTESGLNTDEPRIEFSVRTGRINADLTVGIDVTKAVELKANAGLCSPGVKLHGSGFIVTPAVATHLGLGRRKGLERYIRCYRNGRDLTGRSRGAMVIDFWGMRAEEARRDYPEAYEHLLRAVKPERDRNNRTSYRENWWTFGEPRSELRAALDRLPRYIATVETAKHRTFQFLDASILPDNMIVAIADDDAATLAVLSSRIHTVWAPVLGGWLGYGNDPRYSKSRCFDPFPFPVLSIALREKLRAAGEELDVMRKRVLRENPGMTLTGLYNLLAKVRSGASLDMVEEVDRDRGQVLILQQLHEVIDQLTAESYGWSADLTNDNILSRLVALNAERAREEASGHVKWLRPQFQEERFSGNAQAKNGELDYGPKVVSLDAGLPSFPSDRHEQPLAVLSLLRRAGRTMNAKEIARGFKGGGKRVEKRVGETLNSLALYGHISALDDGGFVAFTPDIPLLKAA